MSKRGFALTASIRRLFRSSARSVFNTSFFKKNSRLFNFEGYALRKQREGGGDRFWFSVADTNGFGGNSPAASTTPVVVGQFYHVIGTYDGSTVKVYLDGVLEGQAPVSLTLTTEPGPYSLGRQVKRIFNSKLNGVVDEASIYNRALDGSEVIDLHAAGPAGKCASVTGLISSSRLCSIT